MAILRKVTYIISDIDKALAFEWVSTHISKEKVDLSFILLNPGDSVLEQYLKDAGFTVYRVCCRSKKDWLPAIRQTYQLLKRIQPHAVHCHLFQANIIGLIAAKLAGVKRRIYTRHHSSLHHVYFPKGVWWDKLANKLATEIVAISGIVQKILIEWEHVPAKKVVLIPHGFELRAFTQVNLSRVQNFKNKYSLEGKGPIIGVISRFTEWKGVQFIIPAFKKVLVNYPNSVLLMLNGHGDYEQAIINQLQELPEASFRIIKFEKDIIAAYHAMNVFIHVPIDEHSEAFGQIYVEALAAGVPSIFTRSGIANESYYNEEMAVIVDHKNSDQIELGIAKILEDNVRAEERISKGKIVAERFDLPKYIHQLEKLYTKE